MSWTKDAPESVRRYLEALGEQNWDQLEQTLAPAIVRIGPYSDVIEGSRAYRDFLAKVVSSLKDYELRIERVAAIADSAWVRLSETISDDSGQRLRTEEALVFDLDAHGKIARVEVYTRKSGFPDADAPSP
jgi:ketosteroid isomerase-like protein